MTKWEWAEKYVLAKISAGEQNTVGIGGVDNVINQMKRWKAEAFAMHEVIHFEELSHNTKYDWERAIGARK